MRKQELLTIRSIIWLIIGGAIELIALLLIIHACLDYRLDYISGNPFFSYYTNYALAIMGFILSLVCIVIGLKQIKGGSSSRPSSKTPLDDNES